LSVQTETGPSDTPDRIVEQVAALPLVDHHCHGLVPSDLDRDGFEALISEAGAPVEGATNFDTPLGLAIRRHCAPVLDLARHAPAQEYVERRHGLGVAEVHQRFLAATGTARFCVDTGFRPDTLTTPAQLAGITGGTAHEIVRLETVAESLMSERAGAGGDGFDFADRLAARVQQTVAERGAVGVKTVAAYRVGFDLDPSAPDRAAVAEAAEAWRRHGPAAGGGWRLDDAVLTRALWWAAVELGLPIQFHVGFGDADIRMHRTDPSLLTDWLHRHRVPVMLLHCWPYHRQAGFLAAVHPHVYLDVGLTLHYVGPTRARAVLEEAAELAPFTKLLYSSDAFAAAELYHLGALTFRQALGGMLSDRVAQGEWAEADAVRIAGLIGHDNATRVYRLGDD
jgi:predicted TIM-barrel fold metal-dependent hydrolase